MKQLHAATRAARTPRVACFIVAFYALFLPIGQNYGPTPRLCVIARVHVLALQTHSLAREFPLVDRQLDRLSGRANYDGITLSSSVASRPIVHVNT